MSDIGNKRVSQLTSLTSTEVQPDDLLLIIDVTARESKNITVSALEVYLQGSGSLVENAISASYVPGSGVGGAVALANMAYSSSTSLYALLTSQSLSSISSSYAKTASYALNAGESSDSASYLIYSGFPNGTASYSLQSLSSNVASTANFLTYFGGNNGTASYAINTQNTQHAILSDTASYVNSNIVSVSTASYALVAQTSLSGLADSASYLIFSPNNGTASYAMAAQSFANVITDQGVFLATTQSSVEAQLDDVDILWSTTGLARTPIEVFGTIKIPFTASMITDGTIYLGTIDRNTGFQNVLDSSPITFNLGSMMGSYGNYESGSVRQTFNLMGQADLYGSYLVFVSASNNLQIDSTRAVRFNIATESDTFNVYPNVPIHIDVTPSNSALFTFTSTDGGPFQDYTVGLLNTMSLGKQIFTLDAPNQSTFTAVDYLWTLTNVTESNFSNNSSLSFISGIPSSLTYLSCSNCHIFSFYTFQSSSLSVFNCSSNNLTTLPLFPASMSYIDCSSNSISTVNLPLTLSYLNCSNNFITTFPLSLPSGLTEFLLDNNNLQYFPLSLPNTIVTMSFNNNTSFSLFSTIALPTSLGYLSLNNCPVGDFPTLPVGILYLSSNSCSLSSTAIDSITNTLVANNLSNGTIDVRGNGVLSLTSLSNMTILSTSGWTTYYDI